MRNAVIKFHGTNVADISRATGISYGTIWRHLHNERAISAKDALRYEAALGIPRWELRPDLWEAPAATAPKMNATADTKEAADAEAKETNE